MNATQLVAEYLIIGGLLLFGFFIIYPNSILQQLMELTKSTTILFVAIVAAVAYVLGFFVNILAEAVTRRFYRFTELSWMKLEGDPSEILTRIRYDVYAAGSSGAIRRLEYQRSLVRLARGIGLATFALLAVTLIEGFFSYAVILVLVLAISAYAFHWRVVCFTKSAYNSWLAIRRRSAVHTHPSQSNSRSKKSDAVSRDEPAIVVFAGGSGFRDINIELCRLTSRITRVVPVWDNGGSSKQLRMKYGLLPVGDIRHALMTMACGERRVSSVVRLFNWRLPYEGKGDELRAELGKFIEGKHPLLEPIDPSLREIISTYLQEFHDELRGDMDLRNGSIGNFVLTGAYLAHGRSINNAIYVFRQLCLIDGQVWPVSQQNDLHLGALLEDGKCFIGEEQLTNLDRSIYRAKIGEIFFTDNSDDTEPPPQVVKAEPNELVLQSLMDAKCVVFGPGSFFTSILPHLMVNKVADTLASLKNVPKLIIGNMAECRETYNYTFESLMNRFLKTADANATAQRPPNLYITHMLVNSSARVELAGSGGGKYLEPGSGIERFVEKGIKLIRHDFEDPWKRGNHYAETMARIIYNAGMDGEIDLKSAYDRIPA